MEKAIKQRLLGGLVLVAGAALFLPILLDGAGSQLVVPPLPVAPRVAAVEAVAPKLEKQAEAVNQAVDAAHQEVAPEAPAAASAVPPAAQDVSPDPAAVAPASAQAVTPVPAPAARPAPEKVVPARTTGPVAKKAAEPAKPAEPVARDAAGLPQAWVVQVASLSSRDKADSLVQKLRKKGFHAQMHEQGGEWKVLVGPELRKELAEAAKQHLAADPDLKLNGWLQPYKP